MKLLFVSSNRLGDAVLSSAVLRFYLEKFPGAEVVIGAGPVALGFFEAVPGLRELIPMRKGKRGAHWRTLYGRTWNKRWDLVIDMRGSAIAYMVWTRMRARPRALNETGHRVDQYAKACGVDALPLPTIWTTPEQRAKADVIMGRGPVLAIGPTANWQGKIWPDDKFADLIRRLTGPTGPLPGAKVLMCGAPHERDQALGTLAAVPDERRIEAFGDLSLLELGACLSKASLYVGNDSGLMHLAAAAGAPTLGLFGPSREAVYAPRGRLTAHVRTPESFENIFPPGYHRHTTPSLMQSLTVETVEAAARDLYDRACAQIREK